VRLNLTRSLSCARSGHAAAAAPRAKPAAWQGAGPAAAPLPPPPSRLSLRKLSFSSARDISMPLSASPLASSANSDTGREIGARSTRPPRRFCWPISRCACSRSSSLGRAGRCVCAGAGPACGRGSEAGRARRRLLLPLPPTPLLPGALRPLAAPSSPHPPPVPLPPPRLPEVGRKAGQPHVVAVKEGRHRRVDVAHRQLHAGGGEGEGGSGGFDGAAGVELLLRLPARRPWPAPATLQGPHPRAPTTPRPRPPPLAPAHLICSLMAASRRSANSVRARLVVTSPLCRRGAPAAAAALALAGGLRQAGAEWPRQS
jgi:hypothetical protein